MPDPQWEVASEAPAPANSQWEVASEAPAPVHNPASNMVNFVNSVGSVVKRFLPQASAPPAPPAASFAEFQKLPKDQQDTYLKQHNDWMAGEMTKSIQLGTGFGGAKPAASAAGATAGALADTVAPGSRLITPAKAAFQDVSKAAGGVPIEQGGPWRAALELRDLSKLTGEYVPGPIRAFLDRVGAAKSPLPGYEMRQPPLNYDEARKIYSAASRLSVDELNKMSPTMKGKVVNFVQQLGESIADAAGSAGKRGQYEFAMSKFAQGMRNIDMQEKAVQLLKDNLIKGLIYGSGVGAGGAALYGAYKTITK